MKSTKAEGRTKTTKQWSQKLLLITRWSDPIQRIQLLKQSAKFIDTNYTRGIVASDINTHLGLHARKVNEIFQRFYGISTSIYLRQYKCRVLWVQIVKDTETPIEVQYKNVGMTGSPSERRAFKTMFGISVDEHWNQSKDSSAGNRAMMAIDRSLPNAMVEALDVVEKLISTQELQAMMEKIKGD